MFVRYRTGWLLLLALVLFPGPPPVHAGFSEIEVKAAFLFNFAHFTEWPPATAPVARGELVIGIMGKDPFGPALRRFRGKTVGGVPVRIRRISTPEEARRCHILYLSPSLKHRTRALVGLLQESPVLTVSDMQGFLERGGCIELMQIDHHIRFAVNLDRCRSAGLILRSNLLELARYVIMPEEDRHD
ncbi:uncharacterized protein DUF4154 [Geothermobacter ehrlichii]|uniref:Uncharacterized protein DUF4154 n=1 Tax=Geothermobacter ehrlichii TaxID=213224 RepID=A0A5D3WLS8_9BACT|nr:YfiR family protein [Geothermobacter ehrlichii]TYO98967.1 uncharacterized protein DUF4154 [Geothermobacter ehrlichii]